MWKLNLWSLFMVIMLLKDIQKFTFFEATFAITILVGIYLVGRAWIVKERETEELNEKKREEHRDADIQSIPFQYQIDRHANEALAIRYGIANLEKKVKEYTYYGKGGVEMRNPDRDREYYVPSDTILLRKYQSLGSDQYLVELSDYGKRKAKAVIEKGTEYVKTFLPMSDDWFIKHAKLEETLKNNHSFSLKELAHFHVQKTL